MVVGSGGGGRPREEVGPESLKEMEEEERGGERRLGLSGSLSKCNEYSNLDESECGSGPLGQPRERFIHFISS